MDILIPVLWNGKQGIILHMGNTVQLTKKELLDVIVSTLYLALLVIFPIIVMVYKTSEEVVVFASAFLVLFLGEATVVITYFISLTKPQDDVKMKKAVGISRLVEAIGTTFFFIMISAVIRFYLLPDNSFFFMAGMALGVFRIVVCFFKGNSWEEGKPSNTVLWIRNVPQILLIFLTFISVFVADYNNSALWLNPIGYSFIPLAGIMACYIVALIFLRKGKNIDFIWLLGRIAVIVFSIFLFFI